MELHLTAPFTTSFGTYTVLQHPFIKMVTNEGLIGWGEVPTLPNPAYKAESDHQSVWTSLNQYIVPSICAYQKRSGGFNTVDEFTASYSWIKGAHFAKSGLEAALWDIFAQKAKQPLWKYWGGTKKSFPVGVSIGGKTIDEVFHKAEQAVAAGYKRLKVKVWPGFEYKVTKAIRSRFPEILLQLDANSSYTLDNWKLLKKVDPYNLLLIEQPLYDDDIVFHAKISAQLQTPICLDESIHSLHDVKRAYELWKLYSTPKKLIINIKPPRVSGFNESLHIVEYCKKKHIKAWIGGMLDSALGKLYNLNFNARIECNLPGDHFSPTGSYFKKDVVPVPLKCVHGIYTERSTTSHGADIDEKNLLSMSKKVKEYKF